MNTEETKRKAHSPRGHISILLLGKRRVCQGSDVVRLGVVLSAQRSYMLGLQHTIGETCFARNTVLGTRNNVLGTRNTEAERG